MSKDIIDCYSFKLEPLNFISPSETNSQTFCTITDKRNRFLIALARNILLVALSIWSYENISLIYVLPLIVYTLFNNYLLIKLYKQEQKYFDNLPVLEDETAEPEVVVYVEPREDEYPVGPK